jgi:hypothetical protein
VKTRQQVLILGVGSVHHLNGDSSANGCVNGLVHNPHAALADDVEELVTPDLLNWGFFHLNSGVAAIFSSLQSFKWLFSRLYEMK